MAESKLEELKAHLATGLNEVAFAFKLLKNKADLQNFSPGNWKQIQAAQVYLDTLLAEVLNELGIEGADSPKESVSGSGSPAGKSKGTPAPEKDSRVAKRDRKS